MLFDRSWYNRAGVERVMGFATDEQVERFLQVTPPVEQAIINSGVILVKYWLEVSKEEQTRRFEERIDDCRKIWKLTPMDLNPTAAGMITPGPRRHVCGHRHAEIALVCGGFQ